MSFSTIWVGSNPSPNKMTTKGTCLTLQHRFFEAIQSGQKTIEGRTAKPKYELLKVGDEIVFTSATTGDTCRRTITGIRQFPTFKSMLQCYGIAAFLTDAPKRSIKDACEVYYTFGDYKKEEEAYGVIALHI